MKWTCRVAGKAAGSGQTRGPLYLHHWGVFIPIPAARRQVQCKCGYRCGMINVCKKGHLAACKKASRRQPHHGDLIQPTSLLLLLTTSQFGWNKGGIQAGTA